MKASFEEKSGDLEGYVFGGAVLVPGCLVALMTTLQNMRVSHSYYARPNDTRTTQRSNEGSGACHVLHVWVHDSGV